ncbi:MAG: tail fiber protein [Nitrospina sp.]|nr:tail fiber protein [Nitrospina sp.]
MADTANFAIEKPTPGGFRNIWGGTLNTGFDKLDELIALAMPVGTIQMYPLATAPVATTNGGTWLACDATAVSRTVYSALYAIIGTSYGVGDGSTTFNLPDLRSRVPVGYNVDTISGRSTRAIAIGSGTETHTLLDAEIPKHTHPTTDAGHDHATTETAHTHTGTTADSSAVIVDPGHGHELGKGGTYSSVGSDGTGQSYTYNSTEWAYHYSGADRKSENAATGITDSGHSHSITGANLASVSTGLTIDSDTTGITVDDQATGDGAHNIMQPYLVVNYIILAKHPTFT